VSDDARCDHGTDPGQFQELGRGSSIEVDGSAARPGAGCIGIGGGAQVGGGRGKPAPCTTVELAAEALAPTLAVCLGDAMLSDEPMTECDAAQDDDDRCAGLHLAEPLHLEPFRPVAEAVASPMRLVGDWPRIA